MTDDSTLPQNGPPLTPIYEAVREYLALRDDLCELEDHECSCDLDQFHTCETCTDIAGICHRQRSLMDLWGEKWAIALVTALPFQVWCECGHISGQHGGYYPHKCTASGGCEKECYGFRAVAVVPPNQVTMQDLLNSGLNAFGLQLFIESIANLKGTESFKPVTINFKGMLITLAPSPNGQIDTSHQ